MAALRMAAGNPELLSYQGAGTKYAAVGHTAAHWCAARGHVQCLEMLLLCKADVNMCNKVKHGVTLVRVDTVKHTVTLVCG